MKNILLFILLFGISYSTFSKPVDEITAKKVGLNFLVNNTANAFQSSYSLQLVYKSVPEPMDSSTIYYYVFNSDHGFVIVAGDDRSSPILGYSEEGVFSKNDIPIYVVEWLDGYKNQIINIIKNNVSATLEINGKWINLIYNNPQSGPQKTSSAVAPLLKTKWNQEPYYNALCPISFPAGCVATAMAQIMKFWNFPNIGAGSNSYFDKGSYMNLSADFGNTTYQWDSMPNSINHPNHAISTLMYHCGVSVNMKYNYNGSSADVFAPQKSAAYALKTYFGYNDSLIKATRSSYNIDTDWINLIKAEINNGRPVLYVGGNSSDAHAFVCDGYDIHNNLHCNWGWGGAFDGYYSINALNPGNSYYSDGQCALIGIRPTSTSVYYKLALKDSLKLSHISVSYMDSFKITTNIVNINYNSHVFLGDFCAEIFDSEDNLIDSFGTNRGLKVDTGQATGSLTFLCLGKSNLLPGNYIIKIFYEPKGENFWSIINKNDDYLNQANLQIFCSDSLELSSPISALPSSLFHGNSITAILNIVNRNTSKFDGTIYAFLYNLNGRRSFLIGNTNGTLLTNQNFTNGLAFANSYDSVEPGNYLLTVFYSSKNGTPIKLVGSGKYKNPIKVTISTLEILSPDKYEPNNSIGASFPFLPNFKNDSAEIITAGANVHNNFDLDFYKIHLAKGYYYTIRANLFGFGYVTDSLSYTLDGNFSISTDSGTHWSFSFNEMPDTIISGGRSIFFYIQPNISGEIGTYLLDVKLTRKEQSDIPVIKTNENSIKIFPNPAQNILNIDCSDLHEKLKQIMLTDMTGKQETLITNPGNKKTIRIPVQYLQSGMYILQLQTENGLITRKISITK